MKKKVTQCEENYRISKPPVEENVAQVEEENKPIPTEESDAIQADSNSLVKPECNVQKRTMKELTELLNENGFISSKQLEDNGFRTTPAPKKLGSIIGAEEVYETNSVEIDEDDLNEDEKNTPKNERLFFTNEIIKEMQYRGEIVNLDDRSLLRVAVFDQEPNLQELEKWGLLVNYDRYNDLLDKGAIDPTVNNRLTIPSEVSEEIEKRREQNFPAAMQRYGDVIHIKDEKSSCELQNIGIITNHHAITIACKNREDEYNKNLKKLTKRKLPK